jgi:hypothetical protein
MGGGGGRPWLTVRRLSCIWSRFGTVINSQFLKAPLSAHGKRTKRQIRQDVLAAEAKLFDPHAPSDVGEVVNYVRAMQHGLVRLDQLPISLQSDC